MIYCSQIEHVTTDDIAGAHPHVRSRTLVAMTFARLIFF